MSLVLRGRRGLTILGAMLLLSWGTLFFVERTLEATLRGLVNVYLKSRTLAVVESQDTTAIKIELPVVDLSLLRRRMLLRNVRVLFDRHEGPLVQYYEATAERVTVTGLDVSDLIWHRSFRLNRVTITAPKLRHSDERPLRATDGKPKAPADTLPLTLPSADSLLFRLVADWLPDELRHGRIEEVRVDGAVMSSRSKRGDVVTTDSSDGLSFVMLGLQLDTTRQRVFEQGSLLVARFIHATTGRGDSLLVRDAHLEVGPRDTSFSVAEMRTGPSPSGHALRLAGIRREQILTIDTLEWAPLVPDSTYFRAAGPGSSRIRATLAGIRTIGLRNNSMRRRRLTASAIFIASADLDVLADYRRPVVARRQTLWPTQFARLAWVVGADSIVLASGRIRYSELRPGARSPGVVTFDGIHARILNASNDPAAMRAGPVLIEADAQLFGSGPLRTWMTVPVRAGLLKVHAQGRLGAMAITEFNGFVLPANGIEITNGALHEATFSFDVLRNEASGEFRGTWEGLDLRLVDEHSREQNLGKKLATMLAKLIIKDHNMPDQNGQVDPSPIHYEVTPEDTFWGLLWQSIKSGIVKAIRS